MKKVYLLLFIVLFSFSALFSRAQESISISFNYGDIFIHCPDIKPVSGTPVRGFSINYALPNRVGNEWRKFFNYPNTGYSYNFKSYGNPQVLGNSHSLTAFMQLSFLPRRKYLDFGFKGFAGLGCFTNKYNPVHNPTNQAVSTYLNVSADARFFAKIRVKPVFLEYSYGLNHFSNGLIKAPNLGINVFNNNFLAGIELEEQMLDYKPAREDKKPTVKNEYWLLASTGKKQINYKSTVFTFSGISLSYSRILSKINKLGISLDLSNDPAQSFEAFHNFHFLPGISDFDIRFGLSLHHEFMMGNLGFLTTYGYYLKKSEYYTSQRYFKAGFKYYIHDFFGAVLVRAIPLFRADIFEFGIGFRITG